MAGRADCLQDRAAAEALLKSHYPWLLPAWKRYMEIDPDKGCVHAPEGRGAGSEPPVGGCPVLASLCVRSLAGRP